MSKFDELLASLNSEVEQQGELAKSLPAVETDTDEGEDDATIAAAAGAEGAAAGAAADAGAAGDGDEDDAEFGKSFEFTAADGSKQKGVDATDLVKSLMERQDASEGVLAKALESITAVTKTQGELIKSLSTQVQTLSAQGRGRKTMVAISEKPALGDLKKSDDGDAGMSTQEFFAKANTAFDAGKITGKDLNVISVSLRMNEAHTLDKSLVTKVLSA